MLWPVVSIIISLTITNNVPSLLTLVICNFMNGFQCFIIASVQEHLKAATTLASNSYNRKAKMQHFHLSTVHFSTHRLVSILQKNGEHL